MDLTHPELPWRTSSHSSAQGQNCVQVASIAAGVAVRDSKNPDGGKLVFTASEWSSFVAAVKDGTFDR
ncbi:DUF397 domain-containing protein [Spongiactinospora sp. TRM90649]|uniref:DUF397 domain-containing protein n=1 Tax=Spongiactinospora sp. TRM90649 TaxID=3031114 RepID=UPI0023F9A6BC|nr:DUF397 domain-containing protein [Spongiactinospora sp. TRM90649]MDF5758783.1 DUF397 domain-containing protein [Spongiactinospora sp. TRM90649]